MLNTTYRVFSLPFITMFMFAWLPFHWLVGSYEDLMRFVNLLTLFVILLSCLGAVATSIAISPIRLWYPITWFLLTTAAYYGFGPLVYYYGTPESIDYSNAFYYVGDVDLYYANLLNLCGIISVMGMYVLLDKFYSKGGSEPCSMDYKHKYIQHNLLKTAVIFVTVGIPVKMFLVLPRALGLTDTVVPGGIEYFSVLSTLALAPLFILFRTSKVNYIFPFYALLMFEVSIAFIMLSKLAILKVGIVLLLAGVLTGVRIKKLVFIGLIVVFVYALILTPLITLSRLSYNVQGLTSVDDTHSAIMSFSRSGHDDAEDLLPNVQSWWTRLNYANAQTFAIRSYDEGYPGDTVGLATYAFIPRLLYPNKPDMNSGLKFNALVTGDSHTLTHASPGMFAEAYWNGGLAMSIFVFLFMGMVYWVWELYAEQKLKYLKMAYMPVMWIGMFMAIQQDAWFAGAIVGAIPIAIVFHFLAVFIIDKKIIIIKTS